jgi:MFS family permease
MLKAWITWLAKVAQDLGGNKESYRAIQVRNYRLFFYGQLISMVGTWMRSMVQSWLVFRLTGSAFWLGIIAFSMQGTAFVTSPFAGVVVDRLDRRKLLIWIEVAAMVQALLQGTPR